MIKPLLTAVFAAAAVFSAAGTEKAKPSTAATKLGLAYEAVYYLGKPEKALSLLYNMENEIPELKYYVFFVRGEALAKSANPLAAQMYMRAEFHPSNPLRTKALEKAAETLEKHENFAEAEKIYKALLNSEKASRKDLYLKKTAEIFTKKGLSAEAAELWTLLWENHPASSFADRAPDEIAALGSVFSPSEETLAARADKLFELGKWKKALVQYRSLPQTPERNVKRAVCLYKTGKKDPEKLKKALALLEETKSAEGIYRKGLILERIAKMSDSGREKRKNLLKAVDVFKAAHRNFPGSGRAGDSLVRAQKIMLAFGKAADAEQIYSLAEKSYLSHRAAVAWNLGWFYYKTGKYKKAARIFSENRRPGRSMLKGQFAYWTARTLEKTGAKSEAQTLLLEVASQKPFNYYSFLASEKTGRVRSFSKPETNAGSAKTHPGIKKARLLLEAKLNNWAATEAYLAGKSSPGDACEILAAVRRYGSCIKLAGNYPSAETGRFSFPKGFESEVKKFAAENGLEELLVYSLIREESRFEMMAVSHANAFGLMQIIIPTAKEVAEKTGAGEITREKLFLPEVNIKIGSRYLAQVLKRFKGDTVAALAGYNAGPSRVAKWRRGPLKDLEPDEFTEEIPFRETRNYVKRIFRSYGAYRALYGAEGSNAAKLRRIFNPAPELLSGWNWQPNTLPFSTAAVNLIPCSVCAATIESSPDST